MNSVLDLGKRAKAAFLEMAVVSTVDKNEALLKISQALIDNTDKIIAANEQDIKNAKEKGIKSSMIDRLTLTEARIKDIANAVHQIIELKDPVGEITNGVTSENGLKITNVRVPFGVVAMIYEARPNVTVDAATLSLKSGNCCILRGGSEAICSNTVLTNIMREALKDTALPQDAILLVENTSRESAKELMSLVGYVDLLIPRGGAGLIKSVMENAKVPVIETGAGNCHTFVDESADIAMAVKIAVNARASRPSVCNSMETLLVHENIAKNYLIALKPEMDKYNVELRGCEQTKSILPDITDVTEEDYETEFNDYILAVRVVKDIDTAIKHIQKYTTAHSEAIITNSYKNSEIFISRIDAAAVYVNASTRFTDGGVFGYGAEIGISTQKMHIRGPMGLRELTTNKFVIRGDGQIRE